MTNINLVFPHQLFEENPLFRNGYPFYLVEEQLFFRQFSFHKQKISFHRASMKFYEKFIQSKGIQVTYVDSTNDLSDIRRLIPALKSQNIAAIHYIDTTDNWLNSRILTASMLCGLSHIKYDSLLFLNPLDGIQTYFEGRKRFSQTDFYINQRKTRNLLLDSNLKPLGGQWTLDHENRRKYPGDQKPPEIVFPEKNKFRIEAREYSQRQFSCNYGSLEGDFEYPCTFDECRLWFSRFLETRFDNFGWYEDAIVKDEIILHHSLLSPLINTGLISPQFVIDEAISRAEAHHIPLNSLEGFVRQIVGWREFIRAVYEIKGSYQRTMNFWGFKRTIPRSFWEGTTGILPLDTTIRKVLRTGYCHHIERLMVLGNFMLLCEFDPDEVYRWFMEMFIDAFDWVMVPNVYGMSQFADGGIMSSKPYISGSNYLMKMSDYPKGEWQLIWDALFWRFMDVHRHFFLKNPRLSMLVKSFDKMPDHKRQNLITKANIFLEKLN